MLDVRARVVIEAVARQAIQTFVQTGQAIKGVGDEAKKQQGALGGAKDAWKSLLGAVGLATAALYSAKKAFDFAREGAEIQELRGAFAGLATEAGQSSNAIVSAIKRGAEGTISQMDAMATATRVMNLGIASSPAEFEKLANVAETLGDRLGKNTAQSIDDVSAALTSLMPRALRSAGITADAEGVWQRYATSVGKTVVELTDAAKRTALLDDATRRLGAGTASTADKFDQFEANLKDLKAAAAVSASEGFGPLIDKLADTTREGLEFSTALEDLDYLISKRLPFGFTLMADGTIKAKDDLIRMNAELLANRDKFQLADSELVRYANHLAALSGRTVSTTVVTNYVTGGGPGGPGANLLAAYRQDPSALTSQQAATARRVAALQAGVQVGLQGGLQHGGPLGAVSLVGEVGPELVINGVVVPTSTTRELMRLGLMPGRRLATGGVFIDGTTGTGSITPSAPKKTGTAVPSKEFGGSQSAAELFGTGGGGATTQAATVAVQEAATAAVAELAPILGSAVITAQSGVQQAAVAIQEASNRTVAATEETNALLRELLELTSRQGDAQDVGRAVRDGLAAVEG